MLESSNLCKCAFVWVSCVNCGFAKWPTITLPDNERAFVGDTVPQQVIRWSLEQSICPRTSDELINSVVRTYANVLPFSERLGNNTVKTESDPTLSHFKAWKQENIKEDIEVTLYRKHSRCHEVSCSHTCIDTSAWFSGLSHPAVARKGIWNCEESRNMLSSPFKRDPIWIWIWIWINELGFPVQYVP